MLVHIDEPDPKVPATREPFMVQGWIWAEAAHDSIERVEAWIGDFLVGDSALELRPDVVTALNLTPNTRTGFLISNGKLPTSDKNALQLHVTVRHKDGTRTPPLATVEFSVRPFDADPLGFLRSHLGTNALGLEIGAHALPVSGLTPFYTDSVAEFAGSKGQADFLADARALPIPTDSLDYLCSSHVLEHLPDPLGAVYEWLRVLKPGGWLYLVVPDKRFTFDRARPVTPVSHLVRDFLNATRTASLEDVEEFTQLTDWSVLRPNCPTAEQERERREARKSYLNLLKRGEYVDIHYHTFTPGSLEAALTAVSLIENGRGPFRVMARAERYPPDRGDGIGLLLQKYENGYRPKSVETFALQSSTLGVPILPLVCPVNLSRLECSPNESARVLVEGTSGRTYQFHQGIPVLLPPQNDTPQRSWTRGVWRYSRTLLPRMRNLWKTA